jgi:hypothetical protein
MWRRARNKISRGGTCRGDYGLVVDRLILSVGRSNGLGVNVEDLKTEVNKCERGLEIKFREGVLVGGIMGRFFIDLSCRLEDRMGLGNKGAQIRLAPNNEVDNGLRLGDLLGRAEVT